MGGGNELDVDPRLLRLPPARATGADPAKLHRQIAQFRRSTEGMPRLLVYRTADDELVIYDGVTRATRAALLGPGRLVPVEVVGSLAATGRHLPTVGDRLP